MNNFIFIVSKIKYSVYKNASNAKNASLFTSLKEKCIFFIFYCYPLDLSYIYKLNYLCNLY